MLLHPDGVQEEDVDEEAGLVDRDHNNKVVRGYTVKLGC